MWLSLCLPQTQKLHLNLHSILVVLILYFLILQDKVSINSPIKTMKIMRQIRQTKNSKRISLLESILGILSRNKNKELLSKLAEQEIHYLSREKRDFIQTGSERLFLDQLPIVLISLSLISIFLSLSLFTFHPLLPTQYYLSRSSPLSFVMFSSFPFSSIILHSFLISFSPFSCILFLSLSLHFYSSPSPVLSSFSSFFSFHCDLSILISSPSTLSSSLFLCFSSISSISC